MIGRVLLNGLAMAAGILLPVQAEAAIGIRLTWTRVYEEVSPHPQTHVDRNISVNIGVSGHAVVARGRREGTSQAFGSRTARKDDMGGTYNVDYAIRNGTIVRVVRYFGSTVTIRIRTNGQDSCSGTITYSKLPGHRFFDEQRISNGEIIEISREGAQDIACSITNE